MNILLTGGLGYIGSHICVKLLELGHNVIVVDNLINSKITVIDKLFQITGKEVKFYHFDLLDKDKIEQIFMENKIDSVIHLAALKSVPDSINNPLEYYRNNVGGTLNLLDVMEKYKVFNLIYSSSAVVYGKAKNIPITEKEEIKDNNNPYGMSKFMVEKILENLHINSCDWAITILRYFNPVGAHKSGKIGDNPNGKANNLMPVLAMSALKSNGIIEVYGNDYNTPDGYALRDFIHIEDLANAHVLAMDKNVNGNFEVYNIGTGIPHSVLEVIEVFNKVNKTNVEYIIKDRRKGDIESSYCNPEKAKEKLGFCADLKLEDMVKDAFIFQEKNLQ